MSDVFISYSREDLDKVTRIAEAVKDQGYDLWWDKDLPPHLSYTEVIQEKISNAKAVIVVWSEEAAKSEWVRAEADMARNQNKLIQTSIDDGMPPLPFNQIQFASLSDWSGERDHPAWSKVLMSLSDLARREPTAAPTAKPRPAPAVPAPQPVRAEAAQPTHSKLPLAISLVSLFAVVGLFAWFFLLNQDDSAEPVAPVEPAEQAAETIEPADAITPPVSEPAPPKPVVDAIAPPAKPESADAFALNAVIEDADGWTNFREGPSRSSPIIRRIETGEIFKTHRQEGSWWKIRTANGTEGYMHYSRISITANQPQSENRGSGETQSANE